MVITDNEIKEALRSDIKSYAETQSRLLEQLGTDDSDNMRKKMNPKWALDGKTSVKNGRVIVAGLVAMAAIVIVTLILYRLLPSLRSSVANDSGTTGDDSQILMIDPEFATLYPDKTILTWVCPSDIPGSGSEVFKRFNQRLAEKGYDFVVNFVPATADFLHYDSYLKQIHKNKAEVDIFNIGFSMNRIEFSYCVSAGMCAPWNSFLESTEGEVLLNQFSDISWKSVTSQDTVYAMPYWNDTDIQQSFTMNINPVIAERYGIDCEKLFEDTDYFWEMLKMVSENETDPEFQTIIWEALADRDYLIPNDIITIKSNSVIGFKRSEDGKLTAVNLLEDPRVILSLISFSRLHKNGDLVLLNELGKTEEECEEKLSSILNEGNYFIYLAERGKKVPGNISYNSRLTFQNREGLVNCVASWSSHQEEAFRLLAAVYTDAELSNLLGLGIEGEHYTVDEDGYVQKTEDRYPPYTKFFLGNRSLLLPEKGAIYSDMNLTDEDINNANPNPLFGNLLDYSDIYGELKAVLSIQYDYYVLAGISTVDDIIKIILDPEAEQKIDDVLAKLNEKLREKGLQ